MDEELSRQMREAFPEAPLPARPVTGHRCLECDEADALLGGRPWPAVAADFPGQCHDVFHLLTPAAQRYYLPAFMLSAFGSSGMQSVSLESALTGGTFDPVTFTPAQRAAVARWVAVFWGGMGWDEPPGLLGEWWPVAGGR